MLSCSILISVPILVMEEQAKQSAHGGELGLSHLQTLPSEPKE